MELERVHNGKSSLERRCLPHVWSAGLASRRLTVLINCNSCERGIVSTQKPTYVLDNGPLKRWITKLHIEPHIVGVRVCRKPMLLGCEAFQFRRERRDSKLYNSLPLLMLLL